MVPRDPWVELLDEGRTEDRVAAMSRERALRRAAEEGATLVGLLVDLAERGSGLVVRTRAGRRYHGVLVALGADYCVVRTDAGTEHLLRFDAITSVRPQQGEHHVRPAGDRTPAVDLLLIEALGRVVDDRPRLVLVTADGEQVAGELCSVGADVITLALDGQRNQLCFVAAASVTDAVLDMP